MNGNVSMKIFRVKISDAGKYFCILESMQKEASIQLNVGELGLSFFQIIKYPVAYYFSLYHMFCQHAMSTEKIIYAFLQTAKKQ